MSVVIPVFQFEVRYNYILNFLNFYRKLLSPYLRLSSSIKIENQNTLDERLHLNFEDEKYIIIIGWDRIVIRGQGDLKSYLSKNSPIEMPFFDILEKMTKSDEFGGVLNVLLAINFIKKLDGNRDDLFQDFISKSLKYDASKILGDATDAAIRLETKSSSGEESINFGPYFGKVDLKNKNLYPVDVDALGDIDFSGIMMEYRCLKKASSISFKEFIAMAENGSNKFDKIWKRLQK